MVVGSDVCGNGGGEELGACVSGASIAGGVASVEYGASTITVRVEVEVRPVPSVAT